MRVQVEKMEHNMAKLTIEVSAEELEKAIEGAYHKNKNKINIPGFRKGKAPRKMIEKMYGAAVFYEDAANAIIPDAYEKEVSALDLEIVSRPVIDVVQIESGKPFIFTAEVAVKPEVTLGKYNGVKIDKIDVEVTDEEVEAEIKREREKDSRTVEVTDRAVQNGDIATLDFEGFVDGVAFEGGKGTDYPLTIGSGSFIPGFEEKLIGAEIGKEVDVEVTFPIDYHAEELAGKPAVFKCTVKKLQEKQIPDLDEDFANNKDCDTVEEYVASVRTSLEERKASDAKFAREEAVVDAIIADAQMDIPAPMVEYQQNQMIQEYAQRLQSQGISMEQYMQFTGLNPQTLMEQVKPQALRRIQSRLCLEAIVAAENIVATEEDFDAEAAVMAETYQMEVEKVKELLGEEGKKSVMTDICIKKAVDFAVANAKEVKPKKSSKKAEDAETEE